MSQLAATVFILPEANAQVVEYTNTIEPFKSMFTLYVDPELLPQNGGWSVADFNSFMNLVVDSDTTNSTDAFPKVWNYFCFKDMDSAWNKISFYTPYDMQMKNKIQIQLDPEGAEASPNGIIYLDVFPGSDNSSTPRTPSEVVDWGFCHELAHICYYANELAGPDQAEDVGARWTNELMAQAGGYATPNCRNGQSSNNTFYDTALINPSAYQTWALFHSYLFSNYQGTSSSTDDIQYNWVRLLPRNLGPYGLGQTLETLRGASPSRFSGLGEGPDQLVGNLFHRWACALYINNPSAFGGLYDFTGYDNPNLFNVFNYVGSAALRVRVVPPDFTLGQANLGTPKIYSLYTDPQQDSTVCDRVKELGIREWGTDYMIFRADPAFFATAGDTILGIRLDARSSFPAGCDFRIGYIAYGPTGTPVELVEQVNLCRGETPSLANFCVEGFGRTKTKIVVVMSLVQSPLPSGPVPACSDNSLTCMMSGACSEPFLKYRLTFQYAPKRLFFPSDFPLGGLQDAINAAAVNQIVTVQFSAAGYTGPIAMRRGVKVEADPSDPRISTISVAGGNNCDVWFPDFPSSIVDTTSVLKGFRLVGGSSATVIFNGSGKIENCIVERDHVAGSRGVLVDLQNSEAKASAISVIRNCTINATYNPSIGGNLRAIETSGRNSIIEGCKIRMNGAGVGSSYAGILSNYLSLAGHVCTMRRNLITGHGGIGIKSFGTADLVEYCTIDSIPSGVYMMAPAQLKNSIVANTTDTNSISGNPNIQNSLTTGGIAGSYSGCTYVSTDPLFCGGGEYTLRVDSKGNPENNSCGVSIGAFPVSCAWGTLAQDVIHYGTPLSIKGDLTIPSGRRLFVNDAPLTATPQDFLHAGWDVNTVQILVQGRLQIRAVNTDSVLVRSSNGGRGSWDGIIVPEGGKLFLSYVSITDAKIGIRDNLYLTADTISADHCNFRNFQTAGIYLYPSGFYPSDACPLTITNCNVFMSHAPYGIYLNIYNPQATFYNVVMTSTSVYNNLATEGTYGIYINGQGLNGYQSYLANNRVVGLPYGTGIFVQGFSPRLFWNGIDACQRGMELRGNGFPVVKGGNAPASRRIKDCNYGLVVGDYSKPDVDSLRIIAPFGLASCYGLYGDDMAGGTYSHMTINMSFTNVSPESLHVATAFQAYSHANPDSMQKLRNSSLLNFFRGVNLDQTSAVDLGGNGQNKGNNQIFSNYVGGTPPGPAVAFVGAHSRAVGLPSISAKYNYWGNAYPPASMIATWVNYSNWLSVPPASAVPRDPGLAMTTVETVLISEPNPFHSSLNIRLEGLRVPGKLDLSIFDVQGRQVRHWTESVSSSRVEVIWDGRGEDGNSVPAGLYFVKGTADEHTFTAKLVRLAQ